MEVSSTVEGTCPANDLKITFTHAGVARTLRKHTTIYIGLRNGTITLAAAKEYAWYLRHGPRGKQRTFKLNAIKEAEAIREATDVLKGQQQRPSDWQEYLQTKDAAKTLALPPLAKDWLAAGLPFSRTFLRTPEAAEALRVLVTRALKWPGWAMPIATITHDTHSQFAAWRGKNTRKQSQRSATAGSRSTDKELAALSCLCQWAIKLDRLKANPFENRERFQSPDDVRHCHLAMPDNDEQFHRILAHFFDALPDKTKIRSPYNERVVIGAWLAFSALSGLRPGEHDPIDKKTGSHHTLLRVPEAKAFPSDLRTAPCGLIYPMPDGTRRMKVFRTKHGQNPAILIHPALQDFLDHYLPWLNTNYPLTRAGSVQILGQGSALFPGLDGEWMLGAQLKRACKRLGVAALKPHGFGRAYYVRVRRSQGTDDSAISVELGQTSDGKLIRSVYGDPLDPVGGNLHNWLPGHGHNAWAKLTDTTIANLIAL